MYFVDSHLHLADMTWENLKSMYLAGVRVVVSPAQLGAAKPVSIETIKDVWDFTLEVQEVRAKEHFIKSYALIGISSISTPKDDLSVVLDWLPEYLKRPDVLGIGEIGIEPNSWTSKDLKFQERIVREQLKLLKKFNKAVVFHLPSAAENKIKYTRVLLDMCREYDIPMSKVVVDHCSEANLEMVLQSGAFAAITVQPWRDITPETAAGLIIKYGYDRIIVNSDCSDFPSDPLSVPKTAYALRNKGASENIIERTCCKNALEAYSLDECILT